MKLSKTSWLILTVGIFIIAFASVGFARSQRIHEQNQLHEELSLVELRLSKFQLEELASQQEELEKQLSQTMLQLETAKATLSQPTESITASDTLFDIAKTCGVEITEISSSGLTTGDLEGITCSVLSLTVRVEGNTSSLISFITTLNDTLTTGVVKSVEISIPAIDREGEQEGEEEEQEEEEEKEKEKPSANIHLVIYTYQGD